MLATLQGFLAEGRFGPIVVGMTREEVLAAAGLPAEFHRGETAEVASVWVNGRVTFWFDGDRLDQIGVYYVLSYPSNPAIQFDANFPERAPELDTLKAFMRDAGIAFSHDAQETLTAGGVQINANPSCPVHSMIIPARSLGRREPRRGAP